MKFLTNSRKLILFILILLLCESCTILPELTATQPTPTQIFTTTPKPSRTSTSTLTPTNTATNTVTQTKKPPLIPSSEEEVVCLSDEHSTSWNDMEENWLHTYYGSVEGANNAIGLTVTYSGNTIAGFLYFNDRPDEFRIKGCLETNRSLSLYLFDTENESLVAFFSGEFPITDPKGTFGGSIIQRELIVGSWNNQSIKFKLPEYLSIHYSCWGTFDNKYLIAFVQEDSIIDNAAQTFKNSVSIGDKESVAQLINFPIRIEIEDEAKIFENQTDFINLYDSIFPESFKLRISRMFSKYLFVNIDGISMGRGDIWFNMEGKIVRLSEGILELP